MLIMQDDGFRSINALAICCLVPGGYISIQLSSSSPLAHQIVPIVKNSSGVDPGGFESDQQTMVASKATAIRSIVLPESRLVLFCGVFTDPLVCGSQDEDRTCHLRIVGEFRTTVAEVRPYPEQIYSSPSSVL